MLVKVITIFGVSYMTFVSLALALILATASATGLITPEQPVVQNIGFVLNLLAFAAALNFALSWKTLDRLGRAPGPLAFRALICNNRFLLATGCALAAVLSDLCLYMLGSWYFVGDMHVPASYRLALMAACYGILTLMLLQMHKDFRNGAR